MLPFDFRESEVHIHYNIEDVEVQINFFLNKELHLINRKYEDTMETSMNRLLLNFKKKKVFKYLIELFEEKHKNDPLHTSNIEQNNDISHSHELDQKTKKKSKQKKKKQDYPCNFDKMKIRLLQHDRVLNLCELNNNQWENGMTFQFVVATNNVMHNPSPIFEKEINSNIEILLELKVVVNPPMIGNVHIYPSAPFIYYDCPIVPTVSCCSMHSSLNIENTHTNKNDICTMDEKNGDKCVYRMRYEYAWYIVINTVFTTDFIFTSCTDEIYTPDSAEISNLIMEFYKIPDIETIVIDSISLKFYCTPVMVCDKIASENQSLAEPPRYGRSIVYYINGVINTLPYRYVELINNLKYTSTTTSEIQSESPLSNENNCNAISVPKIAVQTKDGDVTRVMSYNILSDAYCDKRYAQGRYDHIGDRELHIHYRCQLVFLQIKAHQFPHMINLQECDEKIYLNYYKPILHSYDYSCHYTGKTSGTPEGCALFIHPKYQVKAFIDLNLNEIAKTHPLFQELFQLRPDVYDILVNKLGTIAQVAICELKTPRQMTKEQMQETMSHRQLVILANTHIFFHPAAEYVRVLQVYFIMEVMQKMKTNMLNCIQCNGVKRTDAHRANTNECVYCCCCHRGNKKYWDGVTITEITDPLDTSDDPCNGLSNADTSIPSNRQLTIKSIFSGDFNSTPETATVEFLLKGVLDVNHHVWTTFNDFSWGRGYGDPVIPSPSPGVGPALKASHCDSTTETDETDSTDNLKDITCDSNDNVATSVPTKVKNTYINPADHSQYYKLRVGSDIAAVELQQALPKLLIGGGYFNNSHRSMNTHNSSVETVIEPTRRMKNTRNFSNMDSTYYVSACGFPDVSNYTKDFKDLLDYIFIFPNEYDVSKCYVLPTPTDLIEMHKDVDEENNDCALPSPYYPSDHLPLVVDLYWK